MVPIMPVGMPASSRMARTMWAVVVLPFVPVMPTTRSFSAGRPKKAALNSASASRVFDTKKSGAPPVSTGRSARTAQQPASPAAFA